MHHAIAILVLSLSTQASADEVTGLLDVSGSEWRASCKATPLPKRMIRQSRWAEAKLTVHYTDAPKNYRVQLSQKLCNLFDFSLNKIEGTKRKLWGDIPYHYYIAADGQLGEGRDPLFQVDSNTPFPLDGHIGIVIEGDEHDGLTVAQRKKLFALLAALQKKHRVAADMIGTHKDYAQTDCPGPAIVNAVAEFKNRRIQQPVPQRRCLGWRCPPPREDEEDDEDEYRGRRWR